MKRKSKFGSDVYLAPWDCVLNGKHPLFFSGLLEVYDIRFFLETQQDVYVVTIPRRSIFRLIDESHLQTIFQILTEAEGEPPLARSEVYYRKTWKAWGTPFLKDVGPLVFLDYPKDEQFQYIILTEDESPEFVCYAPKIDAYPNGNSLEIMKTLFEEDIKTRQEKNGYF
jgi:hypothetical protein